MRKIRDGVPQLVGLKHSGPVLDDVREFANMGLACFVGNAKLMLPALTIGAIGCIDGPLNVAPELWVEIWDAYQAGDLARAEVAQDRASQLSDTIVEFGFPACIKAALGERLGIECGDPRPPQLPLTTKEQTALGKAMKALGLTALPGLTTTEAPGLLKV